MSVGMARPKSVSLYPQLEPLDLEDVFLALCHFDFIQKEDIIGIMKMPKKVVEICFTSTAPAQSLRSLEELRIGGQLVRTVPPPEEGRHKDQSAERMCYVKVFHLPFEMEQYVVENFLSKYGNVAWNRCDKFVKESMGSLLNGVRTFGMTNVDDIPNQVVIGGFKARIWYREQPQVCYYCRAAGHVVKDCPGLKCRGCGDQGHIQARCPAAASCDVCYEVGHRSESCPNRVMVCDRCGENGHLEDNCPDGMSGSPPPSESGISAQEGAMDREVSIPPSENFFCNLDSSSVSSGADVESEISSPKNWADKVEVMDEAECSRKRKVSLTDPVDKVVHEKKSAVPQSAVEPPRKVPSPAKEVLDVCPKVNLEALHCNPSEATIGLRVARVLTEDPFKLALAFRKADYVQEFKYFMDRSQPGQPGYLTSNVIEEVSRSLAGFRVLASIGLHVVCVLCGKRGHFRKNCNKDSCHRCKDLGHHQDECPLSSKIASDYVDFKRIHLKRPSVTV